MESSSSQEISKPPSELYSFLIGWENIPLWIPDIVKFEPLDGEEGDLDSTSFIHIRFGNSRLKFLQRITNTVENQHLTLSWSNYPFEILHTFDLYPLGDDQTRLVSAMTVQPRNLLGNMLLPFLQSAIRRQQHRSLNQLNDAIQMVTPA